MRPVDWLLLFVTAVPARAVDPVRMQKGMFLLAMEAGLPAAERYAFEPYAYGPMSRRLYADARRLEERGLIASVALPGHDWRALRVTGRGEARACALRATAGDGAPRQAALEHVAALRTRLDALPFAELLADVYRRYPEYAVRSVFRAS